MQNIENKSVDEKSYQHKAGIMGISVLLPPFWENRLAMNDYG